MKKYNLVAGTKSVSINGMNYPLNALVAHQNGNVVGVREVVGGAWIIPDTTPANYTIDGAAPADAAALVSWMQANFFKSAGGGAGGATTWADMVTASGGDLGGATVNFSPFNNISGAQIALDGSGTFLSGGSGFVIVDQGQEGVYIRATTTKPVLEILGRDEDGRAGYFNLAQGTRILEGQGDGEIVYLTTTDRAIIVTGNTDLLVNLPEIAAAHNQEIFFSPQVNMAGTARLLFNSEVKHFDTAGVEQTILMYHLVPARAAGRVIILKNVGGTWYLLTPTDT